ncbi:MAG: dTMP kinase [Nitrospirae bacterium]|nr:dTMP kinase [Nitrospirota bacterium]
MGRLTRDGQKGRRGVLITFEGVEGSGKSTQCARLATLLREDGCRVVETREPGGTPLAERIRSLLLTGPSKPSSVSAEPIDPRCEAHLVLACRSQHMAQVIEPALREGAVVLCDRFVDSTLAYQGYGRGLDINTLLNLNRFATQGLAPDLTLLFDLPVATGLSRRRRERGVALNRMDRETRRFHERVRRGFLDLAARHPRRIKVLDASPHQDLIAATVAGTVTRFLKRHDG